MFLSLRKPKQPHDYLVLTTVVSTEYILAKYCMPLVPSYYVALEVLIKYWWKLQTANSEV